jgi:SPP1 gp7 family putative phage head morphogenesis protein
MPTFETAQILASQLTEEEMKPLWDQVLKTYRKAQTDINAELSQVYAKYLSITDPQDYYNIMIKFDRLNKLEKQISTLYTEAAKEAGKSIAESSMLGMSNTYYRELYTMQWFTPVAGIDLSFAYLNPTLIKASTFGTAELWKEIQAKGFDVYGNRNQYFPQAGSLTDLLLSNRNKDIARIQSTISSGLLQGKSYRSMIKDIADNVKTSVNNAARIVRTEGTRNLNAGYLSSLHEAEAQGVPMMKQWVATLDMKTRSSHGSADGQKRELDKPFNVNGAEGQAPGQLSEVGQNCNCRCSHISVVDGIDMTVRRGRNPLTNKNEILLTWLVTIKYNTRIYRAFNWC